VTSSFDTAVASLTPPDGVAADAAREHLDRLTKPPGSLGRLEVIAVQLAAIAAASPPPVPTSPAVAVFAGDHGVVAEGVTPWPQEVTAQMVANFCAGGAAINVFARLVGASVVVVDVGVATDIPVPDAAAGTPHGAPRLIRARVANGTANLAAGPAMTADEVRAALDVGATTAAELVADGAGCLVSGDMGIGNTTPSAAVIAALTGRAASEVTGRGTGIDDQRLAVKIAVVERALDRLGSRDPFEVLAEVGGLEIAALVGFIVGGAAARRPVLIDGVIAAAALVAAAAIAPEVLPFVIAGHRSVEPGASAVLEHLGLEPLLDLGMRLGEGSGACLAVPIVQAAARMLGEMATFDSAGVTEK
jgi:nicotinate-nucleotide--dimethylbenzimidazole phosphoribosyltransferase